MTTKTNILALGTTARQSLTVTVEQGDVVSVGVFSSASEVLALTELDRYGGFSRGYY